MIRKDELLKERDNEIARLQADIKAMHSCIQDGLFTEVEIKDTNYRLKKEVEELKTLFV